MNLIIKITIYYFILFFSNFAFANQSLIDFNDFQKFKSSIKSYLNKETDPIQDLNIENDFIRASDYQLNIIKDTISSSSCDQNETIDSHRELSELFTELSFDIYKESKNYLIKCNVLSAEQDLKLKEISFNSIKHFYNLPTVTSTLPKEYTFERSYDEAIIKTDNLSMIAIGAIVALGISQSGGGDDSCPGSCPIISMSVNKSDLYDSDTLGFGITVTASEVSSLPVTVNLRFSGSATYGEDYNGPNTITIPSGNLQASINYIPVADNNYEGTETIIVEMSSITNGRAQGTQSVSINLREYALEYQTSYTEDTSYNSTVKGWEEYDNVHGFFQGTSSLHPYDQINAHRALSFKSGSTYLTGAGEYIAIMDSNCDTDHSAFDQKKAAGLVKSYGAFTPDSASAHHCNAVAGFAAGEYDDTTDPNTIMGVAFEAGLHFADWKSSTAINETYWADYQANAINDASNYNAIAHNNSWGHPTNVSEMKVLISNNPGFSTKQILTAVLNSGAGSQNSSTDANAVASFDRYIAALNNFQDHGIIVFSLGNDTTESDAGWNAGMPEWEPSLGEAWLSVGVFQNTGSTLAAGTITRKGNPCGTTAPYCVFLDGWRIGYAQHFDSGVSNYTNGSCCFGSSWTAPIVSGGIALLAQAFPNHTPEQLTDRILATANNTYFSHTGNVEFVNGIKHGYNNEFGHGTPDLLKAMSPVTTSMTTLMTPVGNTIYRGGGLGSGFSPRLTYIVLSNSFGDTIFSKLNNKNFYFYDALNGGFKVPFTDQIFKANSDIENIEVLVFQNIYKLENTYNTNETNSYTNILFNSANANKEYSSISINIDSPSIPIQYFNRLNKVTNITLTNLKNPFLDFQKGGLGISSQFKHNEKKIKIGFHDSSIRTGIFGDVIKDTKTLAATIDYKINNNQDVTFLSGLMIEKNTLLDLEGSGALNFNNTNPHSYFSGINYERHISSKLSISFNSVLSYSLINNPDHSLVKKFTPLTSSSYNLSINKRNIFSNEDNLSINLSQPHRVESGYMNINIPSLADQDGNIVYDLYKIGLEPSGRQIDFGLDYVNKYNEDFTFGISTNFSRDYGHISNSRLEKIFTITGLLTF